MPLLSCQPGIREQDLSDLKSKNIELVQLLVTKQSEIHLQQGDIDSLNTRINHLEQQFAGKSTKVPEPGADELAIHQMVAKMHLSWKKLASSKDPDEILQYFMPMFMATQIDINNQAKGGVAVFTDLAYKCHMRQYKNDVLSENSSVMVTITGRKIVDSWKIANYSVVSFEYTES